MKDLNQWRQMKFKNQQELNISNEHRLTRLEILIAIILCESTLGVIGFHILDGITLWRP